MGTHWQPLNTLKTPRKCKPGVGSGQVGVGWGVGGEGAGVCGHALAAFKYSQCLKDLIATSGISVYGDVPNASFEHS